MLIDILPDKVEHKRHNHAGDAMRLLYPVRAANVLNNG